MLKMAILTYHHAQMAITCKVTNIRGNDWSLGCHRNSVAKASSRIRGHLSPKKNRNRSGQLSLLYTTLAFGDCSLKTIK